QFSWPRSQCDKRGQYQVTWYSYRMPRRTSIRVDLGVEELERRYRAAGDPVARSQWQMVWLLAQREPSARVAAVRGDALRWVRTVARRYNAGAEQGSGDRRHATRGGPRRVEDAGRRRRVRGGSGSSLGAR